MVRNRMYVVIYTHMDAMIITHKIVYVCMLEQRCKLMHYRTVAYR